MKKWLIAIALLIPLSVSVQSAVQNGVQSTFIFPNRIYRVGLSIDQPGWTLQNIGLPANAIITQIDPNSWEVKYSLQQDAVLTFHFYKNGLTHRHPISVKVVPVPLVTVGEHVEVTE